MHHDDASTGESSICDRPHPTITPPHTYITRNTGGFFKETYRSGAAAGVSKGLTDEGGAVMDTDREPAKRNVLTSIFYMSVDRGEGWTDACAHMYVGIQQDRSMTAESIG